MVWFYARTWRYQRVHCDPKSFLRDEEGLLTGPGARAGLTWEDIAYPEAEESPHAAPEGAPRPGALIKLRVPRRTWADDLADHVAEAHVAGGE